ncbi:MAG: glycosyltransferase family 4 protein [Humibacillus sp.]|nr:glycosyltransferase family 4 protein [Humibacillus sp.]MDN5778019.1 glycosyltransferase family 4 protein [Humibacillus sp.]
MYQHPPTSRETTRVVLAHRGDALVPHLAAALDERYASAGEVHTDLTRAGRLLVAAGTVRPVRRLWAERFFKSNLAVALRSRRADRNVAAIGRPFDAIVQVHALFELTDPRTSIYVDCTHQQSIRHWPDWNPLRGRALRVWLARERRQYHAAAHVFAFSDEARESLVNDYDVRPERVSVVGAGVNFTDLPSESHLVHTGHPAQSRELRTASQTILFVGNDFERKGGPELLEAFRLVRERVPAARLQIVGTPHPIAPQEGVEVFGRVNGREAMSQLYRNAAVFCLPSFFDPYPLVVLEAMAHGLPVVATPTCGVPEMVLDEGTGLLVEHGPDGVARLADALVRVLVDPPYAARLGAAGRRRIEERFLWQHVVDRMAPALEGGPAQRPMLSGQSGGNTRTAPSLSATRFGGAPHEPSRITDHSVLTERP